ncbi:unnamed protein product [Mytilus coruscus]|uniref:Uncharacterized protein n=1 Tax=Mytilus coruscus TaxID=42192 RepID=A0A6J8DHC1_MYTCO|nr:unnamed protein product [Mytilus coruscus]
MTNKCTDETAKCYRNEKKIAEKLLKTALFTRVYIVLCNICVIFTKIIDSREWFKSKKIFSAKYKDFTFLNEMEVTREHTFAFVFLFCLHINSCYGIYKVDLQFTSYNCDEDARRLTESKFYNLSWNGQTSPKLCDFSFTGGEVNNHRSYEVCFESLLFDLPSAFGNVELQVQNKTGSESKWSYTSADRSIEKTCVKQAYKLSMSIVLPNRYTEPTKKTYLIIKVTASRLEEDSDELPVIMYSFIITISAIAIFVVCAWFAYSIYCCCAKSDTRSGGKLACIGEALSFCLRCKCFDDCNCRDNLSSCDCEDILKPCGECCSAWTGCCTTLMLRVRGESPQSQSSETTEMDSIPQASEQISVSSSILEPTGPPPNYHSLQGDLLAPPPSYEAATAYKLPSAAPIKY